MRESRTALWGVIAVAVMTACGGGGEGVAGLEATPAATGPQPTGSAAARTGEPLQAYSQAAALQSNVEPVAPMSTELDPLVLSRLMSELDRIEQALGQVGDEVEKREAIEVVKETRAEMAKERPNKLKLRSLLAGLAHGVQAWGPLKGAGKLLTQLVTMV